MNDACVHYWVIDTPDGKTSWGQCVTCLIWREFQNALGDQGWIDQGMLDWEARQNNHVALQA